MKAEEQKNATGNDHRETPTPPPVPPPTPSPQSSRNNTSLLSPWWSESTEPEKKPAKGHHLLMHFTRIVNGSIKDNNNNSSNTPLFTEQCVLLTKQDHSSSTTTTDQQHSTSTSNGIKFLNGKPQSDCRMVCLLRENQEKRKEQQKAHGSFLNPFHGLWIIVATTQARCLEHTAEKEITKKNHADYYTINLGERFSGSGDDVKRMVTKLFAPTQELTRRYIQSWEDGTQSAFLSKFWESAVRGDAFQLVRDSTRRLFKMASGGDKDDNGKDNRS
ncbi:hypothetical protein RO3G_11850 [Lichtheimia corymbifera JMRC:FSU:9682]|uniref:Uncharacterized protein n=1 Tax=Lichtheimia corymbifera JMRC:FSU:9682 TaxID=1263082 RepID=A0A068SC28_9FUNG|nr:hypothetical protein RO3G_11850 [Lichtheimia corymbifera JMRC:FSU:9682]